VAHKIIELDVRDILRAKGEPFPIIMDAVGKLGPADVLELHATFRPDPLLKVLAKQGFAHAVVELEPDHLVVDVYHKDDNLPYFHLDNRQLNPPEPM